MNLYSNKQKWKIVLLVVALLMVAGSLWISNSIVQRVSDRERLRVKQWADAIQKKAELVEFTDNAFRQLRDYERRKIQLWLDATKEISKPTTGEFIPDYNFPLSIINENKDIPVILIDDQGTVSGSVNVSIDTLAFIQKYPTKNKRIFQRMFDDSLRKLAQTWKTNHTSFQIEVVEGLTMNYYYTDSKRTIDLQRERDSLFAAFNKELIADARLVPVVLVNGKKDSVIATNFSSRELKENGLTKIIQNLARINEPMVLKLNTDGDHYLYYDDSEELRQLQLYPYIQFTIIGLFIFIGYLLFSTFRKAEQNQVWAGMAKETAHQLGTPLSSLMAWIQLLESQHVDSSIISEMEKDVERLNTVSQRFSKIGSDAQLVERDIMETVEAIRSYLRSRISPKISLTVEEREQALMVKHNPPLMEWVMENIIKNAVDAMEANGAIHISLHATPHWVHIDIADTGKGLMPKQFKTIFQPGYTTKKRGWGLGLSLVKRIVTEYHKGKVGVLRSEIGKGTTIRISLPL